MYTNQRRAIESFIVAKNNQATIPATGVLVDSSTGNVNLADGQVGLVSLSSFGSVVPNAFVDATPTVAEAPVLGIFQGNENSANVAGAQAAATYPLWARPYESSSPINGNNEVRVTKQAWRANSHNTWVVGNAGAGAVNVANNTEYKLTVGFSGVRTDLLYTTQESSALTASIVTPDFTTLGYSTAQSKDWILTKLAYDINLNSRITAPSQKTSGNAPVVALLLSTAGAAGSTITALTAGTQLTVATSPTGINKVLTLTSAMVASIQAAATAAGLAGTTTIIPVVLSNAGVVTATAADALMLMALTEKTVYADFIPQTSVRLRVGLTAGFDAFTVANVEGVKADPGQGDGRTLDLMYKRTQGQRKYWGQHITDPVINFPSPVITSEKYVTYVFHHGNKTQIDTFNSLQTPFKEIVLIPAYAADGTTTNPLIAVFDTRINSWLASSQNSNQILTLV